MTIGVTFAPWYGAGSHADTGWDIGLSSVGILTGAWSLFQGTHISLWPDTKNFFHDINHITSTDSAHHRWVYAALDGAYAMKSFFYGVVNLALYGSVATAGYTLGNPDMRTEIFEGLEGLV